MATEAERHAPDELLTLLRSMLEPDGYGLTVEAWPPDGHGHPRLRIDALEGACADCLVPKDVMRLILANRLPEGMAIDDADLVYPGDEPSR